MAHIISFDSSLNIDTITPEQVYQGSIGINDVVVLAPTIPSSIVQISYNVPDGTNTPLEIKRLAYDGPVANSDLHMWKLSYDSLITEYAGIVEYTVYITTIGGQLITTGVGNFTVEETIAPADGIYTINDHDVVITSDKYTGPTLLETLTEISDEVDTKTIPPILQDTPPSAPEPGEFWWNSVTGSLKIWYEDIDSAQWVDAMAVTPVQRVDNTDYIPEGTTNLYYTDARTDERIALVIDGAPGTLDTLNELAAALGDDANFANTVLTSLSNKVDKIPGYVLSKNDFTDAYKSFVIANNAKVGITTQQATDITTNNSKISYTDAAAVALNTDKVGITPTQAADILLNNAKTSFGIESSTKLAGIEDNATADQTASEIKTAYESNLDTNAFTNAYQNQVGTNAAHIGLTNNPHGTTAAQLSAYTSAQTDTAITTAIGNLVNGAGAAYDTLVEIQALMEADDTQTSGMITAIGLNTAKISYTDAAAVALNTDKLSASVNATNQGNTFNGVSQLVQLNGAGQLPALDGSLLTGVISTLSDLTDTTINTPLDTQFLIYDSGTSKWINQTVPIGLGSVTSVGMTVPTGLSVSGTPITDTGTFALSMTAGYEIPTTSKLSEIDANTLKISYTDAVAVGLNTAKISYTDAAAVGLNTAKISYTDAAAVALNTAKISFDTTSSTKLATIQEGAQVNPVNTDSIAEGTTNFFYTDARADARVNLIVGAAGPAYDTLVEIQALMEADDTQTTGMLSAIGLNTAKVGITPTQADNILTNNAKVGITPTQAADIVENNTKISYTDATAVGLNTAKISYTDAVAVGLNTAKISYTDAAAVALNTAKVGITAQQASDISTNNTKISYTDAAAVALNTAKVGITAQQTSDITANNAKVGITAQQTSDILTNNDKVGYTDSAVLDVAVNKSLVNGSFAESFDAIITTGGTNPVLSLEKAGTGDLTMQFSTGDVILDCTPALEVNLIYGTATVPLSNYTYVPISTKLLTNSTIGWPTEEHIKVAYSLLLDITYTDGPLVNQNWNDHLVGNDGQGHLLHLSAWARRQGATYFSGIDPDGLTGYITIDNTLSTIYFKSTAGVIAQLHPHTFLAKDTNPAGGNDDMHIVNHFTTPYLEVHNIADIVNDANGDQLDEFYNLVIWGVANKGGTYDPLMINVPVGSYSTEEEALSDSLGYDVYTVPREFGLDSSTGFLIARITLREKNGTHYYIGTKDLRGIKSNASGGSGVASSGGTQVYEIPDSLHRIYNLTDGTKKIAWNAGSISTETTRTITMADTDINLADIALKANISDTDTSAEVDAKIAALVDSSPATLDTLNELAAALGDDPNFATTVTNSIALKESIANVDILKGTGWTTETVKDNADNIGLNVTAIGLKADTTTVEALTINDMTDVVVTTPVDKEVLQYNGTQWINAVIETISNIDGGSASTTYSVSDILIDGGAA